MAERVAAEIETRIIRNHWPTGHVIGSEAELLSNYAVSRAILREAIRILEHQSIATMRKGPGGGLVVAEPSAAAVSRAIAVYMRHQRVSPSQLLEVRVAVESTVLDLLSRHLTPAIVAEIRQHLDIEARQATIAHHVFHQFHLMLARMTGNAALELFVQCLILLTDVQASEAIERSARPEVPHRAHEHIADALIRGDMPRAHGEMERHIRALEGFMPRVAQ